MAAFFCDNCGDPNVGNVSEGMCVDCLMGVEGRDFSTCQYCETPIDVDDAGYNRCVCTQCQEELDMCEPKDEDVPIFDLCDEEYLRGPSF